jgi:hypothetical protein
MAIAMLILALSAILLSPISCLALQQHEPSCPISTLPSDSSPEQPSEPGDTRFLSDAPQELLLVSVECIDLPSQTDSDFNSEILLRFPFVYYTICIPPQNHA